MTPQFADMMSLSIFFDIALLLVQVLFQYHHRFWSYDNFRIKEINREIRKSAIPCLNLVQYISLRSIFL